MHSPNLTRRLYVLLWLGWSFAAMPAATLHAQSTGRVEVDLLEQGTEEPLVCRVKILDANGRELRAAGGLFQSGWNLVESPLAFRGKPGDYTYQVFHGPQFSSGSGGFTLDKKSEGYDVLRLPRHAQLRDESWIGGDLAAYHSTESTWRWLAAEDLDMAVVLHENPKRTSEALPDENSRWVEESSFLDDRAGSGLVFHHWMPPAPVPASLPSSRLLVMAKSPVQHEPINPPSDSSPLTSSAVENELPVHAEIQKLWARDVPIWLASERVDSIQILSTHLTPDGQGATKFSPIVDPDPGRFRGERGPGRLVEYIYWNVLEAGLRIPPSAGSGFGKINSPLGYNRVYAQVASGTRAAWWQAIQAGRSFVTSGPLLRATVNDQPPGAVFREEGLSGETQIHLNIALTLTVSDPVEYLDVIFNGKTLYQARLDEYAKQGGRIPPLSVDQSGWLLIRVVTERDNTYRIATTAPYYCEVGEQVRISKQAVEFFQTWLEKSAEQIAGTEQAEASGPYIHAARNFWEQRLRAANVP